VDAAVGTNQHLMLLFLADQARELLLVRLDGNVPPVRRSRRWPHPGSACGHGRRRPRPARIRFAQLTIRRPTTFANYFPISTSATLLTPLSAIAMFAVVCRLDVADHAAAARDDPALELLGLDVEPHEHVVRLDRRLDVPDRAVNAAMPYGWDRGPLGDGHSLAAPVLGSSRPRYPRE